MRTAEEFRAAAQAKDIKRWNIWDCSLCNYPCAFLFFQHPNFEVVYDSGCDCTNEYYVANRSWEDVAEQYNIQGNPDCIKRYDEFWGFNEVKE